MARQMDIVKPARTVTRVNLLTQSVLTASHQPHYMPTAIHSHSHDLSHTQVTDGNRLTPRRHINRHTVARLL